MSKDVTFDQARRLCVIGFNRLVNKSYNVSTGEITSHIHVNANALDGTYYSAPTVSDALDFIREEKGVVCCAFYMLETVAHGVIDDIYFFKYGTVEKGTIYNSYNVDYKYFATLSLASSALLDALLDFLGQKKDISKPKLVEKSYTEILITKRAKEYGLEKYDERIIRAKSYFDSVDVELAFKDGATIFSTENAQLREVLREIVELTDKMMVSQNDFEYNIASVSRSNAIDNARKLLTDKHKKS